MLHFLKRVSVRKGNRAKVFYKMYLLFCYNITLIFWIFMNDSRILSEWTQAKRWTIVDPA